MTAELFTLGHSTRALEEIEQLLRAHDIGIVADVRRFPRSRRNPQFNGDELACSLPEIGVRYAWIASLGGRRPTQTLSHTNGAWQNPSFHAFADYMLTNEFDAGLAELADLAGSVRTALMCAEAVPWRCHRSLIADALTARQFSVMHILSPQRADPHRLTSFARVDGVQVTYPSVAEAGSGGASELTHRAQDQSDTGRLSY